MAKQDYDDKEIKHLEMIESVIERMGQNSFALKGWTMTLVVAICAFSAAGTERKFALVAIAPIIAFWRFISRVTRIISIRVKAMAKICRNSVIQPFEISYMTGFTTAR